MSRAAGPLGTEIEADATAVKMGGYQLDPDANALVLLHRLVFVDGQGRIDEQPAKVLLRWAADRNLGQATSLVRSVAARRDRALELLQSRGYAVERLRVWPQWRLAIGLGNRANVYEIGFSLHGTYGWPVIPGSTLKGLVGAWAMESDADAQRVAAVLGLPRPLEAVAAARSPIAATTSSGGADTHPDHPAPDPAGSAGDRVQEPPAHMGAVRFLDALPADGPARVTRDVLTPHVQPYYTSTARKATGGRPEPPAEYHNPNPVEFLVVDQGSFAVDIVGPVADDVREAADWCAAALDQLGVGAKTSAGYGYLTSSRVAPAETAT